MLEQLFKLVQSESQSEIIDNPAIPNEQNNHAIGFATDSIFGELKNTLSQGGLKNILGMFTGSGSVSADHPIAGNIIKNLSGGLMEKFGLDASGASGIAKSIVPTILSKLVSKTNDASDTSFNINGIIGSLVGGNSSQGSPVELPGSGLPGGIDFSSVLQNMGGSALDQNHDGSVNIDDLSGLLSGFGKNTKQEEGVGSLLKGVFGG
ncbi:MAG TPA: hypothetical protein PLP34_08840 [Chitinophagaceae bacterium]|nr:hypothetical protein [Chitinophagaceae bacterium]HNF72508.1 hypothetical protein [Chitinophagaceae bacterium]